MLNTAVNSEITKAVIENQLSQWREGFESNRIAMLVANSIGDPETRKEEIRKAMERCVRAIETLEGLLKE